MGDLLAKFVPWLIARLGENTTYRGLVLIATAIGIKISPEQENAITAAGLALAGLLAVFHKQKPTIVTSGDVRIDAPATILTTKKD